MPLFGSPNIEKLKANRDVKGLTKALRHEDRNIRENAVKALGEMGHSSAIEPLLAPSQEDSPDVREAVAEALGKIGSTRSVEPLTAALRDPNGSVRWTARVALDKIGWKPGTDDAAGWYWAAKAGWQQCLTLGARAVEPLIAALKDGYFGPDSYQKEERNKKIVEIAETLGQIGDARAVDPLIAALLHGWQLYSPTRARIAAALGQIGDVRAAEPLVKMITDYSHFLFEPDTNNAVIEALGRVGDTQTAQLLIDTFKHSEKGSSNRRAAQALTKIGPPAVEPLIGAINDRSEWPKVREMAAGTLGAIGDTRAVDPLYAALKNADEALSNPIVAALDQLGWQPGSDDVAARYWITKWDWQQCVALGDVAVDGLIAECARTSSEYFWRYNGAVRALGQIAAPRSLPSLVERLQKDDESRQAAIVQNLSRFDARTVFPAVMDLLVSGGVVVRRRIAGLILDLCLADMCQDTPSELDVFAVDLLARRFEATQLTTVQQARLAGLIQQLQPDHPIAAQGQTIFDLHSAALSAGSVINRAAGAEVIAAFGTQDAEARILDVIDGEKSPDVLKWLAEGLGYCGSGKPAVNRLIGLLDIDHSRVRRKVAWALIALGDPAAVGPLERVMQSKAKTDKIKGYHAMAWAVDILKYI